MTEYGGERQTTPAHVSDPAAGHERSDVEIGPLVMVAVVLAVVTVVALLAVWGAMAIFERTEQRLDRPLPPIVEAPLPPVGPPLQPTRDYHPTRPDEDARALRQRDEQILTSEQWIDRERGVARIPITEAMKILLDQQQQPGAPPTPGAPPADPEVQP